VGVAVTVALNQSQLDWMRTMVGTSLPGSADIIRQTLASDGRGGQTATWETVATVPCRIAGNPGGVEGTFDTRVISQPMYTVTLPAETGVLLTDRIGIDGKEYEVTGYSEPRTWSLSQRVTVMERT